MNDEPEQSNEEFYVELDKDLRRTFNHHLTDPEAMLYVRKFNEYQIARKEAERFAEKAASEKELHADNLHGGAAELQKAAMWEEAMRGLRKDLVEMRAELESPPPTPVQTKEDKELERFRNVMRQDEDKYLREKIHSGNPQEAEAATKEAVAKYMPDLAERTADKNIR